MALKGKKASAIEKRLKMMVYGPAGCGKTTMAIQFPKPYLIDTEKGAEHKQYADLLNKAGGVIFQTSDFEEMLAEVTALLTEKHEYKTLIIDPITTVYNDLLDKAAKKVGTEFGRHYGEANKSMKHLLNLLLRLDMNIIITCHAKNEYGDNLSVLGQTYDGYKKLDYLFDLVVEIQKRGPKRVAIPRKSRMASFVENESFELSYAAIADRYGHEVMERDAVAQVLATDAQVKELERLIELLKVTSDVTDKWLKKSDSAEFKEMETNTIQKCIDHLISQVRGDTKNA